MRSGREGGVEGEKQRAKCKVAYAGPAALDKPGYYILVAIICFVRNRRFLVQNSWGIVDKFRWVRLRRGEAAASHRAAERLKQEGSPLTYP
jgi:hypothetical protein